MRKVNIRWDPTVETFFFFCFTFCVLLSVVLKDRVRKSVQMWELRHERLLAIAFLGVTVLLSCFYTPYCFSFTIFHLYLSLCVFCSLTSVRLVV